jgi:acyl-CoA thioesterase
MNDLKQKITNDPYLKFLGITLDELEKSRAVCSITITADMMNFLNFTHGGLIFSLADVAFSAASNSDHLPSCALDVSGSFLKSASVGDRVTAEARLVHTTKRTGLYRMDVRNNGELIATFNGTVFRRV